MPSGNATSPSINPTMKTHVPDPNAMPDRALSDNPYTARPAGAQSGPTPPTGVSYIGEKRT